jgi:L-ascorbate metabolism protein UlaG (beta-lactamase superfamily)
MDSYTKYYSNDTAGIKKGNVKITFFGVSTLLLDDGETQLMIDGFFSRPSILKVLTSKVSTDTATINKVISEYGVNRLKAIFVTHSHYEHALDAAYIAKQTNSVLHGSSSTFNIGLGGGLSAAQISIFDFEKEYKYGDFSVKVIPSKHSPAASYNDDLGKLITTPIIQPAKAGDYVEGGSFDFLIHYKEHNIYIKPSANYIKDKLTNIKADVLFLGVGGLSNQDSEFMNEYYHQTVETLMPKIIIPLHWDNFFQPFSGNLKMNPRLMDKSYKGFDFVINKCQPQKINFTILQGGKSIVLFK